MNILITGAFGWTAQAVIKALDSEGHAIHALDLPSAKPQPEIHQIVKKTHKGDISDYSFVSRAMDNIDAVINCAIAIGDGDYDTPKIPFQTNVQGFANILEAARSMDNSPRIIHFSSAPIHLSIEGVLNAKEQPPLSASDDFMYDMTKALQEDTAKYFCETFNMSVITLRAGHIIDGREGVDMRGRNLHDVHYARGGWVCRYDLAQAVVKALDYDVRGYDAFHIIGTRAARQHFDIEYTENVLGHFNDIDFARYY